MIANDRFQKIGTGRLNPWYGWHLQPGTVPDADKVSQGLVTTLRMHETGPGVEWAQTEPLNGGFSALRGSMPRSRVVRPL